MSQIIRKIIKSAKAPAAIGPYSQAVQVNNTLYISGCLGMDPQTGNLVSGGTQAEARQAMNNMNAILEEAGITFNNVVKCTILLADINDFASINSIYQEYFKSNFPARATYQVAALPKGGRIEIEAVAVVGDIKDDVPSQL